jgi:hypothetical protein
MRIKLGKHKTSRLKLPSIKQLDLEFYVQGGNKLIRRSTGQVCGFKNNKGYLQVTYKRVKYLVHRIIYKLIMRRDPNYVDHKNNDHTNNSFTNLRSVTFRQNCGNRKSCNKNNNNGYLNIKFRKHGYEVHVAGKYISSHKDLAGAILARDLTRAKIYS